MKLLKIADCYINFENVTHADFETSPHGLIARVYFNCQITDGDGGNGIQASKIFTAGAARDLRAWLELRVNKMEQES